MTFHIVATNFANTEKFVEMVTIMSTFVTFFWYSYAKAHDPDNWFTVDEETAEIRLNKAPDRESPFVINGTYKAMILAITKGNTSFLSFTYFSPCFFLL